MILNRKFFSSGKKYTSIDAEKRVRAKGYTDYRLTGSSHAYGSTYYYETPEGVKIRVSDHALTGQRAFDYVQIRFEEPMPLPSKTKK